MRLCSALQAYRKSLGLSLRSAGKEMKISYSLLDRFERGGEISDSAFVKIMKWLLEVDTAPAQLHLKPTKSNAKAN
jgi:transcriptional regulator with XRE-family HTH domain